MTGDTYGIEAIAAGSTAENLAVNVYASASISSTTSLVSSASSYGILAINDTAGNLSVVTSTGDVITSTGSGIDALNEVATEAVAGLVEVDASGTINSGSIPTSTGKPPAGILAGYLGGSTTPASTPIANLVGDVVVNSAATITATAGDGIRAFDYGSGGDITVKDNAGTITALGGSSPTNGYGDGINVDNFGTGNSTVTTAAGTVIDAGGSGIAVNNFDSAATSDVVSVIALGSITTSGAALTGDGTEAAGILAGFNANVTGSSAGDVAEPGATGNVSIDDYGLITATGGTDGIKGYNLGTGTVDVAVELGATVNGSLVGVEAYGMDGGSVSVMNHGTVTGDVNAVYAYTTGGTGTASVDNFGHLNGDITTSGYATFTNEAMGDWTFNGASGFGGSSTLTNDGLIESYGTPGHEASVISGLSTLTNDGSIVVESGSLKLGVSAVSGTGLITIDSGTTLEIGSSATVAYGQTVSFAASTGTLLLDHAQNFQGTISGFTGDGSLTGSDQIDLANINFNSAHFVESFNATNDILTVSDGSHSATLQFVGSYVAANFSFAADGNLIGGVSGTSGTIVYDPPVTSSPGAAPVTVTNDVFVFAPGSGQATLTDFHAGLDKIELDYFNPTTASGQPESFDQWAAAGGIQHHGADSLIVLDPNHPAHSDTLLLKNVANLSANDFILHPGHAA